MEQLKIKRGDDTSLPFEYLDADGVGIDITGYIIFLTAKKLVDDDVTDALAVIAIEVDDHTDPTNGISIIPITALLSTVEPVEYLADVQIKDDSGLIVSSDLFTLEVEPDITRRTT